MHQFPQRPLAHVVGDEAVLLFVQACPREWVVAPVAPDYGLDVRVELVKGGAVTGEEFAAQIKGKTKVRPNGKGFVGVQVKPSMINYWLGKLHPTMIVTVNTARRRLWYGWLDQVYPDYPRRLAAEGDIELQLRDRVAPDFSDVVSRYVSSYFSKLRDETLRLGDRVQLSRLSLHVGAVARTLTQIHLALTSGRPIEELQDPVHFLFLEYGLHDSFLLSLWEPESEWHEPLSMRVAEIVASKVETYVRLRSHFWMREQKASAGDFDLIPFSYSALSEYLIPTLKSAWDLQDALNQLLVLGKVAGVPNPGQCA